MNPSIICPSTRLASHALTHSSWMWLFIHLISAPSFVLHQFYLCPSATYSCTSYPSIHSPICAQLQVKIRCPHRHHPESTAIHFKWLDIRLTLHSCSGHDLSRRGIGADSPHRDHWNPLSPLTNSRIPRFGK